jgi:hypothetical protein
MFLSKLKLCVLAVVSFFCHRFGKRAGCLTKRAADGGESAPFSSIFHASSFFCSPKLVLTRRPLTQTVGRLSYSKSFFQEKRYDYKTSKTRRETKEN